MNAVMLAFCLAVATGVLWTFLPWILDLAHHLLPGLVG